MCGIAGLLDPGWSGTAQELARLARAMARPLAHRGPDDEGTWCDGEAGVGFGHRRLAVIDLSPAGHQPMVSADGRWVAAYNGECYNAAELRAALPDGGRGLRATATPRWWWRRWPPGACARLSSGSMPCSPWPCGTAGTASCT